MDFFSAATVTLRVLYCIFIIGQRQGGDPPWHRPEESPGRMALNQ